MKTEINLETKQRFFALYWGQQVIRAPKGNGQTGEYSVQYCEMHQHYFENFPCWMELKPLSSITDEDAIAIAARCYSMEGVKVSDWVKGGGIGTSQKHVTLSNGYVFIIDRNLAIWLQPTTTSGETLQFHDNIHREIGDFLRSRGYLLPWMGLSVEEIIEAGWAKYKEQ